MEIRDYLARIGAETSQPISADGLRRLHEKHLFSVPFENLDIHRGVPIVLQEQAILQKIVVRRRGGFCYELNYAFAWLLQALGFELVLLSAEVARPEGGFGIPFDHMALEVRLEGEEWLADVGFGDSFLHPLRLEPGRIQEQGFQHYRFMRRGEIWHLERRFRGNDDFTVQYRFTRKPRRLDQFHDAARYHQTSPESPFTRKLVATRALPDGRVTVTKERVILRRGEDLTEAPIADEAAWQEALQRHLGIVLENAR